MNGLIERGHRPKAPMPTPFLTASGDLRLLCDLADPLNWCLDLASALPDPCYLTRIP
jgi:hypothetical protein